MQQNAKYIEDGRKRRRGQTILCPAASHAPHLQFPSPTSATLIVNQSWFLRNVPKTEAPVVRVSFDKSRALRRAAQIESTRYSF